MKELYFAYGSNMDLDQMNMRVPGNFEVLGVGILKKWEWFVNQRGYANIITNPVAQTFGVLFNLSEDGLRKLDRYEGYPNLYQRKIVPVVSGRKIHHPWVYVDPNSTNHGLPRPNYLERVIIAAMDFKLPNQYIQHLVSFLAY